MSSSEEQVPLQSGVESQPCTYNQCNYLYKEQNHYPVPVIDLKGRLCDSDPEIRAALLQQLVEAGKVGAFCVVNHGIDEKLLSEFQRASNIFFALPFEEKVKCSKVSVPGHTRPVGYHGQFQNLTPKSFVVQRREVFEIQGSPSTENRDLVPWPESVPSFRGCVEAYADEMRELTKWMLEALAEGLGLEKDAFLKQIVNLHQQIIVCSYPVVEKQPKEVKPSSIAFGAHSDLTVMNIALEDDTGGVEVYHDDRWLKVKPIKEGIIFFLGDPMECMSNGAFHAMIHRVKTPENRNRFSCVSTVEPIDKGATTIQPVPELVERSGIPAKYIPWNFLGRLTSVLNQRFDPEVMTKGYMVKDASVLDPLRDSSYRNGVYYIGSRPQGSVTDGY